AIGAVDLPQVVGEFDDGRHIAGDVEVSDVVLRRHALHGAALDVEGGGAAGVLVAVRGDLDVVLPGESRGELPERQADVGGDPGAEDGEAAVVELFVDLAARVLVADVDPFVEDPGPRPAGDRRVQAAVRRLEV